VNKDKCAAATVISAMPIAYIPFKLFCERQKDYDVIIGLYANPKRSKKLNSNCNHQLQHRSKMWNTWALDSAEVFLFSTNRKRSVNGYLRGQTGKPPGNMPGANVWQNLSIILEETKDDRAGEPVNQPLKFQTSPASCCQTSHMELLTKVKRSEGAGGTLKAALARRRGDKRQVPAWCRMHEQRNMRVIRSTSTGQWSPGGDAVRLNDADRRRPLNVKSSPTRQHLANSLRRPKPRY